jgi:hypothetical protein
VNCGVLVLWTICWRLKPGVEALLMLWPVVSRPAWAAASPDTPMLKMLEPMSDPAFSR